MNKSHQPSRVFSLGCRLNIAEGERIEAFLRERGITGLAVVNSCGVTNRAAAKSMRLLRRLHEDLPEHRLVITGCAPHTDGTDFTSRASYDHLLSNAEKMRPLCWENINGTVATQTSAKPMRDIARTRAVVAVQNGCDHSCTFCVIPRARGPSRSVPVEQVLARIDRLLEDGAREIVLSGVDLSSYGDNLSDGPVLGDLVEAILNHTPQRICLRLSSIDGAEIDAKLFDYITSHERIAPHVHLSLQSGDDLILKRMKRRHSRAQAVALCEKLRTRRPGIALGADLIAGFPTETPEMFARTLALIDDCGLKHLHIFPFSARNMAVASRMPQLASNVIAARAKKLRLKAASVLEAFLQSHVGELHTALIEETGCGRLGNFCLSTPVRGHEQPLVGRMVKLRITGVAQNRLTARFEGLDSRFEENYR